MILDSLKLGVDQKKDMSVQEFGKRIMLLYRLDINAPREGFFVEPFDAESECMYDS